MPLNFPKHLTIGSTEWKVQPFKFDIEKINGGYSPSYKDVVLSGVSPLSLPNAQANGLRYIKLFGKCEQTGTPTPDNPVPIMCNNGAVGNNWSSNLFDSSTATLNNFINSSGKEQYNASWACTDYIEVVEGGTYRLMGVSSYGTGPRTGFYKADKTFVSQRSQSSAAFTIPENNDIKYMRMSIYKTNIDTATIQQKLETIETISMNGQTATAQNLLSCDDYVDEQNITTGKITRKARYFVFDGTESWGIQPNYTDIFFLRTGVDSVQPSTCISNYFSGVVSTAGASQLADGTIKYGFTGQPDRVYIRYTNYSNNLAGFKTWLATQYSNGEPVVVVIPLQTPTTETVTTQTNIQTVSGNNTLTITQASVNGLEMEVKYSAGVEVEIEG